MVSLAHSLNQDLKLIEDIVYIGSHYSYYKDLAKNFTSIVEQIICERPIEEFSEKEIKRLEKIVENPFFFDYEFERLDPDVSYLIENDRFTLEPVKGRNTTVHSNKILENYSKLNKNHDLAEFLPMTSIPGVKSLKMKGGTEFKLHYHLFRGKNGKRQLYDTILTFDPELNINLLNGDLPSLYSVRHAEGKAQVKFKPHQFREDTKRSIYDLALKPLLNGKVKLIDFRKPSQKKSTLFYEP